MHPLHYRPTCRSRQVCFFEIPQKQLIAIHSVLFDPKNIHAQCCIFNKLPHIKIPINSFGEEQNRRTMLWVPLSFEKRK